MKPSKHSYTPTHPKLFVVEFGQGEFSSILKTLKAFKTGDVITPLQGLVKSPKAYTSVQCSLDSHTELNSDLVFVNHSCEPNVAFDLSASDPSKWQVLALKDIAVGTPLTFFYPSTEWDMEQPFACECGSQTCLGHIEGAAYLSTEALQARGFVNPWIQQLVAERDGIIQSRSLPKTCKECGHGLSARGDLDRCGCKPTRP